MNEKLFNAIFDMKYTSKQILKQSEKTRKEVAVSRKKAAAMKAAGQEDAARTYIQVLDNAQ